MKRGVLASLRDVVPLRPLSREEALSLAERQARQLLQMVGVTNAPVPERAIAELPRIEVDHVSPFPVSGATHWVSGVWRIIINSSEPVTRQRMSLAHELKHIIDHPFVDLMYAAEQGSERHKWIEQVCDYFAGCVLVPRAWLKRAYANETTDIEALARRFGVSHAAITTRLAQTGLAPRFPRCAQPTRLTRGQLLAIGRAARYRRDPSRTLTVTSP